MQGSDDLSGGYWAATGQPHGATGDTSACITAWRESAQPPCAWCLCKPPCLHNASRTLCTSASTELDKVTGGARAHPSRIWPCGRGRWPSQHLGACPSP